VNGKKAKLVVATLGVLAAAWFVASAVAAEAKKPVRAPVPKVATPKGEKCVEPVAEMRRNHMKYILHQRDETMRRGVRTEKHSLKNCVNCHADPKSGSVRGKDGFCESCHRYAAVTMDCFSCHTDKAAKEPARNASRRRGEALLAAQGETPAPTPPPLPGEGVRIIGMGGAR
jgi:hypothetical protein